MLMFKVLGLLQLLSGCAIMAAPLSTVRLKFYSPAHVAEHELTTDGHNTIHQDSFLVIGRRVPQFGDRITPRVVSPVNTEFLSPVGVFVAPVNVNDLGYSSQDSNQKTSQRNSEYGDPYLVTGDATLLAIRYLYNRRGPFFHEIPHTSSILRHQALRRANGLPENILRSIRPGSPFCEDCGY